ncbi:MAG: hypothetical protein ACKVSF_01885 [Alphaproteobacteria bacterium]
MDDDDRALPRLGYVIRSPHAIGAKVSRDGPGEAALLAAAADEIGALEVEFEAWLVDDIARLAAACDDMAAGKPDGREKAEAAAHDIGSQGELFGFPLARRMARSLCRILEGREPLGPGDGALVRGHVDALKAVARDDVRGEPDGVARTLAIALEQRTAARKVAAR